MAVRVRERIPAHVVHADGSVDDQQAKLEACRFVGTMLHPVPMSEMARLCGMKRRGYRIVLTWPNCEKDHLIQVGDTVEVDGRSYPVRAVTERPGCYVEIYTEEL